MSRETMFCPRRDENGSSNRMFPGPDEWRKDNTCSYCGSMNPDVFLEEVKAGTEIGPTDKAYKVYVGDHRKFYTQHLNEEQALEFRQLYADGKVSVGYPGRFYAGFYLPITKPTKDVES